LLMVYPQVSHDFTAKMIKAYRELLLLLFLLEWDFCADLAFFSRRWIDYRCCGHAEREWVHGFCGRVTCRLVCEDNAGLGESVPDTAAEFRRQG
jgi:hypothetical protein